MKRFVLLSVLLLISVVAPAQPDFTRSVQYEGVRCFRDAKNALTAYYAPGVLKIKQNRDGKPDFNFIKTRYTGTAAYADRGETRFLSYLRFNVVMEQIPADKLLSIKKAIWPSDNGHLRPVPVTGIKTMLIFTPAGEGGGQAEQTAFTNGNLSAEDASGISGKGEFWKEREFSLKLDNNSAQLLSKVFQSGQSLMSLSYAFFSEGINKPDSSIITEGESKILDEIKNLLDKENDSIRTEQVCIFSDAFSITIDTHKWPDLIKNIDINEQIPPGYAAVEIRCYDFNNNLRPDLFAKKVEIKAEGVGRGDVIVKKTFSRKYPDICVYNIRFPYAVRLDKPYYYRTISISDNSPPVKTEWIEQKSWTSIIDVTSTEEQITESNEEQEN